MPFEMRGIWINAVSKQSIHAIVKLSSSITQISWFFIRIATITNKQNYSDECKQQLQTADSAENW